MKLFLPPSPRHFYLTSVDIETNVQPIDYNIDPIRDGPREATNPCIKFIDLHVGKEIETLEYCISNTFLI